MGITFPKRRKLIHFLSTVNKLITTKSKKNLQNSSFYCKLYKKSNREEERLLGTKDEK